VIGMHQSIGVDGNNGDAGPPRRTVCHMPASHGRLRIRTRAGRNLLSHRG